MISVDVFIPCYNYGRYLASCIDSVLSQEGVQVRVLIIDDTSTDDSLAEARRLAAQHPNVEVLVHETNKGHIATYNEGIEWATSDYVTLLSADDLLAPSALARAVGLMEANPRLGFVFGPIVNFTDDRDLAEKTNLAKAHGVDVTATIRAGGDFIAQLCDHPYNTIPASGVVVRTALQQKVGGYLPELPHSGDLEMWLRLATHADLAELDVPQSFTRMHDTNMRHQYYAADAMHADYLQRRFAFELCFERQAAVLPNAMDLKRRACRSLATEAMWASDHHFYKADAAGAAQLAALAKSIDPSIMRAAGWWKLAAKRALGPRVCRAIDPLVSGVRGRSALQAGTAAPAEAK